MTPPRSMSYHGYVASPARERFMPVPIWAPKTNLRH
jgi:hypothetical protein